VIRRVRLRNWKVFDSLQFEPGPGVNFVVAPNGLGKSSLIDGCAWAIFGQRSGIDPSRLRRAGRDETEAAVDLELPDGRALSITRTFSKATRVVATIDGSTTDNVDGVLREALGAELDFLARALLVNADNMNQQAAGTFRLREHLSSVFGVHDLQAAAQIASKHHLDLETANTKRRRQRPAAAVDDEALSAQAETFEAEISALEVEMVRAQESLGTAEAALADAVAIANAVTQHASYTEGRAALQSRVNELLDVSAATDPGTAVDTAIDNLEEQLEEVRTDAATTQARIAIAETGLATLETVEAVCPTCLRSLSTEDQEAARIGHQHELAEHHETLTAARRKENDIRNSLDQLRAVQRQLARLVAPQPLPPLPHATVEVVEVEVAAHRQAFDELQTAASERRGALNQIRGTVEEHRRSKLESREDDDAYRLEAVARLAAESLTATANRLLAEQIEPLAGEVSSRWKQIFGDRGSLKMSADGTLDMERNGQHIQFSDFSPGERMVAMLAVRFLAVSMSTNATFMLMDEPLEHLDPANRRIIAAMIARLALPVRQLIVTTYEEPLVRRLAEMVDGVDVRYLLPD
jgi:DNA repair exonuclease SbcCD ATPase subunit